MADVYLAEDQELGRRVAIKILNGRHANDAQFIERFRREAKSGEVEHRSDLYSLGVVLYELLPGKTPCEGDTPVEIAMKRLSATPKPPSQQRKDIPPELDMVVLRALAKDPNEPYQSADEM